MGACPHRKRAAPAKKGPREKALNMNQQLDRAFKAYRWWEAKVLPPGEKWETLEHHGVNFPPAYTPHGIKLSYDGAEVDLTPAQEEVATMYASMPLDGPQLGDPKVATPGMINGRSPSRPRTAPRSGSSAKGRVDQASNRASNSLISRH